MHVQHRQHVFSFYHIGSNPVDDHLDVPDSVAFEEAGDAVGVAEAGDVGGGDEDGLVGGSDGGDEAGVDAGGAIDEDEVRGALWTRFQRVHEPGEGFTAEAEGELGAGFGDAEEFEVGPALVADEGLVEAAVAVEDLDDGVVDAVLEAEEEVEVAEADVGVDGDHGEAQAGEGEADVGGGGGLAHAALSGGNDGDARDGAGELGLAVPLEEGTGGFGLGFFGG